ncbi:MAG TPA: DUF6340 family protein, partial [Draconibacterium sp.]|nr:DUF6340 family protein [Draconibacterium sp.]
MRNIRLITGCVAFFIATGCNTFYNIKTVDIEVFEPAKMRFPEAYRNVAVQYNNVNISPNNYFNRYNVFFEEVTEPENSDSIASEIYFDTFVAELTKQAFFDTIFTLNNRNYSTVSIKDTIDYTSILNKDSTTSEDLSSNQISVLSSSYFLKQYLSPVNFKPDTLTINPEFGLYTPDLLEATRNKCGADLLLSLDFFGAIDASSYDANTNRIGEEVINLVLWSFYSLSDKRYLRAHSDMDTVSWMEFADSEKMAELILPPRKDAIFNAAEISGEKFAGTLIPHWKNVERMYYTSGHIELKQTDLLIKNGEWLKASKIWKSNTENKNKSIAAKSMFNMGLACEMEGEFDAALEWVVKSYHLLGKKYEIHASNC